MRCLYCSERKTEVTNSRGIARGAIIWRRRHCAACDKTFTTRETPIGDNLFVIKRNGSRQRFVYEKFFASMYNVIHAGKNRDSGNAAKIAKKVTQAVLEQIFMNTKGKNVPTRKIIELSYTELRKIHRASAFAYGTHSAYRSKSLTQIGLMV